MNVLKIPNSLHIAVRIFFKEGIIDAIVEPQDPCGMGSTNKTKRPQSRKSGFLRRPKNTFKNTRHMEA